MDKHDFHIILLHEFKHSHYTTETIHKIDRDWRLQSVSEGTIQRWLENFVSHDLELQDEPDCGQKSSLNNKELMIVMEKQEARY